MRADERRVTASGLVSVATSTTKGMSSGEAIIEALTETIEARRHRVKGGGSPSVLQLSKGIVSLWNESARRHGVLRLFPLDPIGLVLAMKQHTEYASTIKRDLLEGGRNGREPLVMIQSSNLLAAAEEGEGNIQDPPLSPSSPFESSTSQTEEPITPQLLLSDPCNIRRLLAELISATDYSRAAYGYVMAAGHMKSIPDLIKMISGSAFFNPVSGASAEANNEAIESITGIPTLDLLKCEWRNSSFRPCHFLAVDRARRRLVLSIRGSLEVGDLCTDLEAQSQPFHLLSLASQASEAIDSTVGQKGEVQVHHVHKGLLSAALFVAASTSSVLTHATEGEYRGWPLIISGHSLGAGVASLLTLMLRNRQDYEDFGDRDFGDRESGEDQDAEIDDEDQTTGSPSSPPPDPSLDLLTSIPLLPRSCHIFCICIAPPPTLSDHLARQSQSCVLSLVHGMDFVSRLSHHSVELALIDMVQSSPAVKLAGNLMQGLEDGKAAVSALSVEGKAALTNLSKEGREAVSAILGPKGTAVLSALENEGAAVLSALGEEGRAALLALGEEGKAAWSVLSSSIKESVKAIKEVAATSSQSRRVSKASGEGEDADWEFKRWLKSSPAAVLASSPPSSTTRQIEATSPPPDALNPPGAQGGSGDDLRKASGSRTFSRWESIVGTMTGWLEDVFEITDDPGTRKKEETRATSTSGPAADSTTITPIDVQMEDLSPLIPPLAKALEKEMDATIQDLERAVTSQELEEEGGDRLLESAVIKAEETIIKEAEKKMATKLYLPGVILWMFKEDKSKAEGKGDGSLRRSHSSNDESEDGAEGLDEEVVKAAEATEKVEVATEKVEVATEKVAEATELGLGSPRSMRQPSSSADHDAEKAQRKGDLRLCLAQADRECFNKLALVDSCITDHMPDSYKSLLVELRQGVHQNQGIQNQYPVSRIPSIPSIQKQ